MPTVKCQKKPKNGEFTKNQKKPNKIFPKKRVTTEYLNRN